MNVSRSDVISLIRAQRVLNQSERKTFGKILTPPLRAVSREWLCAAVKALNVSIQHDIDEWGDQTNYIDYEGMRFMSRGLRRKARK